mmetsp:Transcript_482/g.1000  ORF Transcript_482/g.1000 Transcript_482/m.1000 type:complete len:283 (-) Transcript_482:101-949(-)
MPTRRGGHRRLRERTWSEEPFSALAPRLQTGDESSNTRLPHPARPEHHRSFFNNSNPFILSNSGGGLGNTSFSNGLGSPHDPAPSTPGDAHNNSYSALSAAGAPANGGQNGAPASAAGNANGHHGTSALTAASSLVSPGGGASSSAVNTSLTGASRVNGNNPFLSSQENDILYSTNPRFGLEKNQGILENRAAVHVLDLDREGEHQHQLSDWPSSGSRSGSSRREGPRLSDSFHDVDSERDERPVAYGTLTMHELKQKLKEKGLSTAGRKDTLVERLQKGST